MSSTRLHVGMCVAISACGPAQTEPTRVPECPVVENPPAEVASPAPDLRAACTPETEPAEPQIGFPALMRFEAGSNTLEAVQAEFGRLVGRWDCTSESRSADGSLSTVPGQSRWTFFYTLDAQAIADVFEPPVGSGGAVGINLRVYDAQAKLWRMAWTTPQLASYQQFEARADADTIVMRGELPARGKFPAHAVKITFFDMSAQAFEWRYEAAAPQSDGPWQEFSRIHCRAAP